MSSLAKQKPVILLEDKDFIFTENQIDRIVELHNDGTHYAMIATKIKRDPLEILLALLHVADVGDRELRPLANAVAPKTEPLAGLRGTEVIVTAKVLKTKSRQAIAIEIDGRRFYSKEG